MKSNFIIHLLEKQSFLLLEESTCMLLKTGLQLVTISISRSHHQSHFNYGIHVNSRGSISPVVPLPNSTE